MEGMVKEGICTRSLRFIYYQKMKESENSTRKGDLLFCGHPICLSSTAAALEKGLKIPKQTALLPILILNRWAAFTV